MSDSPSLPLRHIVFPAIITLVIPFLSGCAWMFCTPETWTEWTTLGTILPQAVGDRTWPPRGIISEGELVEAFRRMPDSIREQAGRHGALQLELVVRPDKGEAEIYRYPLRFECKADGPCGAPIQPEYNEGPSLPFGSGVLEMRLVDVEHSSSPWTDLELVHHRVVRYRFSPSEDGEPDLSTIPALEISPHSSSGPWMVRISPSEAGDLGFEWVLAVDILGQERHTMCY